MAISIIRFDRVRLDREIRDDVVEVVPCIDGEQLTDMIHRFETGAGMKPAGGYGGLIPEIFPFGPLDRHFHGQPDSATPVLGHCCGDWGCWPLLVRITVTNDLVVWDSFEQPHRPTRDYTAFGPFQFDRYQYDNALADLTAHFPSTDES